MKWESSLVEHLQWSDTITNRESKEQLARMIAMRVQEGEIIGAGSGSTVYLALLAIAERIRTENLHVTVIPASMEISMECVRLGIPQTTLWMCRPDWTFDGADEVDPDHNLIKGETFDMQQQSHFHFGGRKQAGFFSGKPFSCSYRSVSDGSALCGAGSAYYGSFAYGVEAC